MNKESTESFGLMTEEKVHVPLMRVDVNAEIIGRSAKVRLIQNFINRGDKPLEAVYKFPLPEDSALCGFRVKAGKKVFEGTIEDRDKAFEQYDEVLSKGHGAYLLDEERPNIFTLSVGNLNPGSSVIAEIEYVSLLESHDNQVRFFLPTTISPRYIPDGTPDDDGIPKDEKIIPDFALDVSYGLRIKMNIHGREGISAIESPSHNIITSISEDPVKVEFSSEAVKMDRDFVLNINYRESFESRGYFFSGKDGDFLEIDFTPTHDSWNIPKKGENISGKEIIFLLDCSGSMQGSSISEAKKALDVFIRGLSQGMAFNIYRFGSSFQKLFPSSNAYTQKAMKNALDYVSVIDADLGGTELLLPLKDIYSQKNINNRKDIVIITDGEVGNESEILDLVREGHDRIRLFIVGIGYGPNEYLIRQLARTSGGAAELIAPGERIEPKVLRLFKKTMSDNLRDLTIKWPKKTEQAPALPTVFQDDTVSIFGRMADGSNIPDRILITAKFNDIQRQWAVNMTKVKSEDSPIPLFWAREMIRDIEEGTHELGVPGTKQKRRKDEGIKEEIKRLSREFGIASRETSFIAVEKRKEHEKTKEETVLLKVPVMLTRGWGGVPSSFNMLNMHCSLSISPISMQWSRYDALPEEAVSRKHIDCMLHLLSLQKAEGGFEIDEEATAMLNTTVSQLRDIAESISIKLEADRFDLLSTALILAILRETFSDQIDIWLGVVSKSEHWLKAEIGRVQPTINGIPLLEWIEEYIRNLSLQI